jgi:hypothetical protein
MKYEKETSTDCYWAHRTPSDQQYPCYDGKSTVCSHCCVERCQIETPDWFAECAAACFPTWPSTSHTVPKKLVCLESSWNKRVFHAMSVKGFFEALQPLIHPPLKLAHRFVESAKHLAYYTRRPDGLLWTDQEGWDVPIFYLAFHGSPATVHSTLESIDAQLLCDAFQGYSGYRNLIYLSACNVLGEPLGRDFGEKLLRVSGSRAVIGYTANVDWMDGLIVDLLFLYRFYTDKDPWHNLGRIFASLESDFQPARRMGYILIEAATD